MNKLIALVLVLVCALGLIGCNNRSMDYIVNNEPSITGIVKECNDHSILIENETGEYLVSVDIDARDSSTRFNVGDEVVVYYDGNVAESYPMQINKVYAITWYTPANRTEKNDPNKTADPFAEIPEFSFAEESKEYVNSTSGVKTSGFVNTSETEIKSVSDAVERARGECTVEWNKVDTFFDTSTGIWKIVFYTEGAAGGDQTVYMGKDGVTTLIVFGE